MKKICLNSDVLIVSCLFTSKTEFGIYPAPNLNGVDCVFFSNREDILELAESRGWIAAYVPFPITDDYLESSLQSKWVKFLQFLNQPTLVDLNLTHVQQIVYFDHKFKVLPIHIENFLVNYVDDIVIRLTPREKTSIYQEIEESKNYGRYNKNMKRTVNFIETLKENGISTDTLICNTGLIYYRNLSRAIKLGNQVYGACLAIQQPECQIFWAAYSQIFDGTIKKLSWTHPHVSEIEWMDPINQTKRIVQEDETQTPGLVVVGFHRSGTSSVAQYLHSRGINMGDDLMGATEFNKYGHYESWQIVRFHDDLLAKQGLDWASLGVEHVNYEKEDVEWIQNFVVRRNSEKCRAWGFKDPRISKLLPMWAKAAPNLRFLIVYRNPCSCANSITRRSMLDLATSAGRKEIENRFYNDVDYALRLWVEHNSNILAFYQANPDRCTVIRHDNFTQNPQVLDSLIKSLGGDIENCDQTVDNNALSAPRSLTVTSKALKRDVMDIWIELNKIDSFTNDNEIENLDKSLIYKSKPTDRKLELAELQLDHIYHSVIKWDVMKQIKDVNFGRLKLNEDKKLVESANEKDTSDNGYDSVLFQYLKNTKFKRNSKSFFFRDTFKKEIKIITASKMFDQSWYLNSYPDVASAKLDPIAHWVKYGVYEGRDPTPDFSSLFYLSQNKDVLDAGMNPFCHYIEYGKAEGREGHKHFDNELTKNKDDLEIKN